MQFEAEFLIKMFIRIDKLFPTTLYQNYKKK